MVPRAYPRFHLSSLAPCCPTLVPSLSALIFLVRGSIAEVEEIHAIAREIQLVPGLVELPSSNQSGSRRCHCHTRSLCRPQDRSLHQRTQSVSPACFWLVHRASLTTGRSPFLRMDSQFAVVGAVEHPVKAHELSDGQLLAVALVGGYVAVPSVTPSVTLKGGQRYVDVPCADRVIPEFPELQVDGEPAHAVAQQERKNLQRCPFEGPQVRKVLKLSVIQPA